MNGTQAEQSAHSSGTKVFKESRNRWNIWKRKVWFWGILVILALVTRGCLVELSKAAAFKTNETSQTVQKWAHDIYDPPPKPTKKTVVESIPTPATPGKWRLRRQYMHTVLTDGVCTDYEVQQSASEHTLPIVVVEKGCQKYTFNGTIDGPEECAGGGEVIPAPIPGGATSIRVCATNGSSQHSLYVFGGWPSS